LTNNAIQSYEGTLGGWQVKRQVMGCFLAALVALSFSAATTPVLAEIYLIKNVKVDAKSKTASEAKIKAMKQGQVAAFKKLISRLSNSPRAQTLLKLPATEIGRLVRGISVTKEKTGPKRYIADLNIAFQPAAVRSLMTQFSIPFSDQQAKPVLILPIFMQEGRAVLWDDPNPLRQAWRTIDTEAFLLPVMIPNGGIEDIQAISADEALAGNADRLAAIKELYKVSDVLISVAEFNKAKTRLRISLSGKIGPVGDIQLDESFPGTPENVVETAQKAATRYMTNLENRWKASAQTGPELEGERFLVTIPFGSFGEWKSIRERIVRTEGVMRLDIRALSQRGAVIYLTFSGEVFQLEERMSEQGLFMRDMGDGWVLTAEN